MPGQICVSEREASAPTLPANPSVGYSISVDIATGIRFPAAGGAKFDHGYRGVLHYNGEYVDSGPHRYGSRAKSTARLDAANLKRRYEHHLRVTGRRLEIERREKHKALQDRREVSKARRHALYADRTKLWHALVGLISDMERTGCLYEHKNAARELVELHRQAVRDIEADPENKRGGIPE